MKFEYHIRVFQDRESNLWYVAYYRRMYLLIRGFWKTLTPMWVTTFQEAQNITIKHSKQYDT